MDTVTENQTKERIDVHIKTLAVCFKGTINILPVPVSHRNRNNLYRYSHTQDRKQFRLQWISDSVCTMNLVDFYSIIDGIILA